MITPKSVPFVDASPAFSHKFSMIFTMRCGSRALKQRRRVSLELSGGWKAPRGMADAGWSDLHLHMKEHIDKCHRMCLNPSDQLTPPLPRIAWQASRIGTSKRFWVCNQQGLKKERTPGFLFLKIKMGSVRKYRGYTTNVAGGFMEMIHQYQPMPCLPFHEWRMLALRKISMESSIDPGIFQGQFAGNQHFHSNIWGFPPFPLDQSSGTTGSPVTSTWPWLHWGGWRTTGPGRSWLERGLKNRCVGITRKLLLNQHTYMHIDR